MAWYEWTTVGIGYLLIGWPISLLSYRWWWKIYKTVSIDYKTIERSAESRHLCAACGSWFTLFLWPIFTTLFAVFGSVTMAYRGIVKLDPYARTRAAAEGRAVRGRLGRLRVLDEDAS